MLRGFSGVSLPPSPFPQPPLLTLSPFPPLSFNFSKTNSSPGSVTSSRECYTSSWEFFLDHEQTLIYLSLLPFVLHFLFHDLGKTSIQRCLDPPLLLHFVIFRKKVLIGRDLFNALPQGRNKSAQTPTSGVDKGHELRGSGLRRQPPAYVTLLIAALQPLRLNPHESILQSQLYADNRHMVP